MEMKLARATSAGILREFELKKNAKFSLRVLINFKDINLYIYISSREVSLRERKWIDR